MRHQLAFLASMLVLAISPMTGWTGVPLPLIETVHYNWILTADVDGTLLDSSLAVPGALGCTMRVVQQTDPVTGKVKVLQRSCDQAAGCQQPKKCNLGQYPDGKRTMYQCDCTP